MHQNKVKSPLSTKCWSVFSFLFISLEEFFILFFMNLFFIAILVRVHIWSAALYNTDNIWNVKIWFKFFFLIIHSTAYLYKFIIYNSVHWQNVVLTLPSEYGKGPGLSSSILNESTIHVLFCLILLWADIVATHCSVEKDKIKLVTF